MFRLHKNRPTKSGERIDFKFSNFKALQVPKGWDKLFVSVISVETGKTIAKSSKALVRNGTCQWSETVSESIWVSQEDSSKELEDCVLKLIVAMGSARSRILGETTLNMIDCVSSGAVFPVSLPLNKCNYGTILQVQIQCLTPRKKLREDESKDQNSHEEVLNAESLDMDIKSDGPDSILPNSNGSFSSKELDSALHKEVTESQGTSFAASDSHQSNDSVERFIEGRNFSSRKIFNDHYGHNLALYEVPDSSSSQNNAAEGSYHVDKPSESNHPSSNSEDTGSRNYSEDNQQEPAVSSFGISASSRSLLEAAEDTVQELRAESKMWERNAHKLMLDLDILRKKCSDQSKSQADLEMELSAACTERDGFRNENEQLKLLLQKMEKPAALEDSTFQDGVTHIKKELEDEIRFQKESNANLALQLKRSQESNIELVTVLQELEETVEKQKLEIENLSSLQSKFSQMEKSMQVKVEENENTMLQLQQLQESERNLQAKVQPLEQALGEKHHGIENQESLNNPTLLHIETEYKAKLSAKDNEIASLKAKLSEFHKEKHAAKVESVNEGEADPSGEIEALKAKLQELERDCNELTDENLELLFKLKEIKNYSSEHLENSSNLRSGVSHHESEVHNLEEKLKKKLLREIKNQYDVSMQQLEILQNELEVKVTGLHEELSQRRSEIERLESSLLLKEEEIKDLLHCQNELEAKVVILQKEKILLEENKEIVLRESDIATKCLNDLRKDIQVLSSSVDSHISANRTLEKKSAELENEKQKFELQLSELEHENAQFSDCISRLEAQLRFLTDESESKQLELENSNSLVMNLQEEVIKLRNDMETQETDMKRKLEDMHNLWSEAQEECEYMGRENFKLQTTANSLVKECSSVQKSNGELKWQKFELQKRCTNLEAKLRDSIENFANCSRKVEGLEENLSSMLEDIALKEKSLTSRLDALLSENGKQSEKLALAESLLIQMHFEKTAEIENLQQEIGNLTKQLFATHDEKERIASEAEREVSSLHADKAKLECAFQELQSKVKWVENELNSIQIESEAKVQGLTGELAASKQNQEMLMANHEKLLKQLEIFKSSEEKFKINLNDLELKLTVYEYERQQLMEESTTMKVQLLRIEQLEQDVLSLNNELHATKFDKEKLKASLRLVSEECEDLKSQKHSYLDKISTLQNDVSELEVCKHNMVALEEKLLQMECDLMEKEALHGQDTVVKNELSMIKKANRQLQWKVQLLEEEKDKYLAQAQGLEEELKFIKEERQNQRESSGTNSYRSQRQREGDSGCKIHDKSSPAAKVEPVSKIQLLEAELAKTKEANCKYKAQIKRLSSEGKNTRANARKSTAEGEVVTKERFERTKSSLESELRDIRERYLQMSLKYAEVEAQREELVMKLRIAKNGKRWFS